MISFYLAIDIRNYDNVIIFWMYSLPELSLPALWLYNPA